MKLIATHTVIALNRLSSILFNVIFSVQLTSLNIFCVNVIHLQWIAKKISLNSFCKGPRTFRMEI